MQNFLTKLWNDESGQDLVEYGLLLAFISLAVVGLLALFRTSLITIFTEGGNALEDGANQLTDT